LTRTEFIKRFEANRRKAYAAKPGNRAADAMGIAMAAEDAAKFWRKHRASIKHLSADEFFKPRDEAK